MGCASFLPVSTYRQGHTAPSESTVVRQFKQSALLVHSVPHSSLQGLHGITLSSGRRRRTPQPEKKKQFPFCFLTPLSICNYVSLRLKNDFDAAITLHNASAWLNCGPCSRLGYLEVHSFAYQTSRAHTHTHKEQLFVSEHQCIPHILLPPPPG